MYEKPVKNYKFIIICVLVVLSIFFIIYPAFTSHEFIFFSYFLFIPVILSALWWGIRGFGVAVIIALSLIVRGAFLLRSGNGGDYIISFILMGTGLGFAFFSQSSGKAAAEHRRLFGDLKESEEKFRTIIEKAPFAYYRVDESGLVEYVNSEWEKMHFASGNDIIGRDFIDGHPESKRGAVKEIISRIMNGESLTGEYNSIADDNSTSDRIFNCQPVYLNGRIAGFEGFISDISEKRKAEEALLMNELLLSQILERNPIPIFVIDKYHKITHWNKACEVLTGFAANVMTGKNEQWKAFYNVRRPLLADLILDREGKITSEEDGAGIIFSPILEEAWESESFFPNLGKEGKWLFFTAALLRDARGGIIGAIETLQDTTQRKKAEQEANNFNKELQLEIEERIRAEQKKNNALIETRLLQKEIMQITEKERQRIGQDLHDGIGQNLTAASFLIEVLREKLSESHNISLDDIDEIEKLVRNSIVQTRSIAKVLYPVEMTENGLFSAISGMVSVIEKVFDVSCEISQEGNVDIRDNQTAIHLYYIAREAVTNAIKHGRAKNIKIRLASVSGLELTVSDDGIGVRTDKISNGMGLRIMKYRAGMIGADFSSGNREQGGFEVMVKIK